MKFCSKVYPDMPANAKDFLIQIRNKQNSQKMNKKTRESKSYFISFLNFGFNFYYLDLSSSENPCEKVQNLLQQSPQLGALSF